MMTQTNAAKETYTVISQLDQEERDRLVLENLPQVNYIARRVYSRISEQVPLEDLMSAGVVGLLEAINHYDPNRNVKLMTFAKLRIEGAMLDSLRDLDWSPRELRRQGRQVEEALQKLRASLGRAPSESEIAAEMGISPEALQNLLFDLKGLDLGSLEAMAAQGERGDQIYNYVPTSREEDPLYLCLQSEIRECLAQIVGELPERERQVLALYYVEELTMKEVGMVLGVGEGRISQIHSAVLLRLRSRLQELLASRRKNVAVL
ncbi:MAG TPA: FliA/WhiG family RNA polymerase sigma factor [Blastocatellia bacterium]|nr:FliA/WhiG family RNA polymerase sigma factor [Blastocatellia bacterium]